MHVPSLKPRYPANLCSYFGWSEIACFGEYFGNAVGETVQAAARSAFRQGASKHLHYVLSSEQRVDHAVQAGAGGSDVRFGLRCQVARLRAGQMELALQVGQRDIEVQHGHVWRGVTEQFHDGGEI